MAERSPYDTDYERLNEFIYDYPEALFDYDDYQDYDYQNLVVDDDSEDQNVLTENQLTQIMDSSTLATTGLDQLAEINLEPLDAEPSSSYYVPKKSSEVTQIVTTAPTHQSRNTM